MMVVQTILYIITIIVAIWSQIRLWPMMERSIPFLEPPFLWEYSFEQIPSLNGTVCLVTGANTGLGLATTTVLLQKGASVIMGCRNLSKCVTARSSLTDLVPNISNAFPMEIDLASLKSVSTFANTVTNQFATLDILILNAAVFPTKFVRAPETKLELAFSVNHVGHFLLATRLLCHYCLHDACISTSKNSICTQKAGMKVAVVSSSHHFLGSSISLEEIAHPNSVYDGNTAYGYSKLANILFTQELSRRLTLRGMHNVFVNAVHPGGVATGILREWLKKIEIEFGIPISWSQGFLQLIQGLFVFSPLDAANSVLYPVTSPMIETHNIRGKYFVPVGHIGQRSHKASSVVLQKEMWNFTEDLLEKCGYSISRI